MKELIKEKSVEIVLTLTVTLIIAATAFYYKTTNSLDHLIDVTKLHTEYISDLQNRMNEKDVQYKEIIIRQDYTIQMLEEMRNK